MDYESFSFKINDKLIKPDAVFNIIHGEPGENGDLAQILEKNKIPQTACDTRVSKLTFNKNKYIENQYNHVHLNPSDNTHRRNRTSLQISKITYIN